MLRTLRISVERRLPNGWGDAARQVGLFAGVYFAYRLGEGAVYGSPAPAFAHARALISFERSLHVFVEPSIQSWAYGSHLLMVSATYLYITAQTFILFGLLLYLYFAHNRSYYFVRNMMFVAMAIALVGYAFYPTAPPRFLANWGFIDTVSQVTNTSARNNVLSNALVNDYAAVPSMHVACAAMLGWTLVRLVRSPVAKLWWGLWPLLITFVTLITANHFLLDTALGLATAGIAACVAYALAFRRPHVWAFRPASAFAPQPVLGLAPEVALPAPFAPQTATALAQSATGVALPASFAPQSTTAVAQSATGVGGS